MYVQCEFFFCRSLIQRVTEILTCAVDAFVLGDCALEEFEEYRYMIFGSESELYTILTAGGLCDVPEDFGMKLPEDYGVVVPQECEFVPTCNITAAGECLALVDAAVDCG